MPAEYPTGLVGTAPWDAFLREVDRLLPGPVELHCTGGFVLHARYGFERPTKDVDYIEAVPDGMASVLQSIAGPESKLAKKHHLCLDCVTISEPPDDYKERLVEMFPQRFSNLRIYALDVHDLASVYELSGRMWAEVQ